MFYSLAIILCLAVLFIVMAGASFLCTLLLWACRQWLLRLSPPTRANLFFMLRALPLFLSGLVIVGLVLPAILRFEPRSSNETPGLRLLALAALGTLLIATIAVRCWRIVRATHRAQKDWGNDSQALRIAGVELPIYRSHVSPLLAVTGLFRPRIFISATVLESLSPGELFAAVAHEVAHVSALDNLKQVVLKVTGAPSWLRLGFTSDAMWLNASEMAADEGALAGGASALDLSSALVKVANLNRQALVVDRIAASHFLPAAGPSCLATRVSHLSRLLESEGHLVRPGTRKRKYWPGLTLLTLMVAYAACVSAVLPWIHEVLELMVK
jgi:Zn-dependent protease with chaperone function